MPRKGSSCFRDALAKPEAGSVIIWIVSSEDVRHELLIQTARPRLSRQPSLLSHGSLSASPSFAKSSERRSTRSLARRSSLGYLLGICANTRAQTLSVAISIRVFGYLLCSSNKSLQYILLGIWVFVTNTRARDVLGMPFLPAF